MKKLKPYPIWVCHPCGLAAMTAESRKKKTIWVMTFHVNTCGVCGEKRAVTEPRDYGYPTFKGFK